jgi:broad specificity phosphatase PhoE
MPIRRPAVLVTVALLLAAADQARAQSAVILVRHAERLDDSSDSPLSAAGEQRAERLARMLESAGVTAIYTTPYQRTVKTAEPLARRLGLKITSDDPPPADLLRRIHESHPQGTVLIVGHSNTVPDLLTALGYNTPVQIPANEYDNLFIVAPRQGSAPVVVRLRF